MSTAELPTISKLLGKSKKRRLLKALLLLAVILTSYAGNQAGWFDTHKKALEQSQPGQYRVLKVEDGDTIAVDRNGQRELIRLIGVDTPETQDPRKAVQCYGRVATDFTKQLIGVQNVRLESDSQSTNRDRYNRLLRYVYLPDGRLINIEIIAAGYGFAYTGFPFTKSADFTAAQTLARNQNKGLWQACNPTVNQYGGFTSNDAE